MYIKQPCPISSNQLIPKGNNCFHCKNCNKTVVDYTAVSKQDLEKLIEKDVCGIFRTDQMEKIPVFSRKKQILFLFLTLISFFGGKISPVLASEFKDRSTEIHFQNKATPRKNALKPRKRVKRIKRKKQPLTIGTPNF